MLTKEDVFVQGERVASVAEVAGSAEGVVAPLSAALKRPTLIGQEMTERAIAEREVTVMADKSLPYEVLKKVMTTCTDADFGRISFALMQKDKPVDANSLRKG